MQGWAKCPTIPGSSLLAGRGCVVFGVSTPGFSPIFQVSREAVRLTKIITEVETERILGVGITGTNAGELIAEATLAIEMGATAQDLRLTIHPHPTLTETIMEAAEMIYGKATHVYKPKRKKK